MSAGNASVAAVIEDFDRGLIEKHPGMHAIEPEDYLNARIALWKQSKAGPSQDYMLWRRMLLESMAKKENPDDSSLSGGLHGGQEPATHPSYINCIHHVFTDLIGDIVSQVKFSPSHFGKLAAGTAGGLIGLLDSASLPPTSTLMPAHNSPITYLAWSTGGSLLLSLAMEGEAAVWFVDDNKISEARRIRTNRFISAVSFAPSNDNFVVLVTDDGCLHTISISSGRPVSSWHASFPATALAWGMAGRILYMGGGNGGLLRCPWDTENARPLPGSGLRRSIRHVPGATRSMQSVSVGASSLILQGNDGGVSVFVDTQELLELSFTVACDSPACGPFGGALAMFPTVRAGGHDNWELFLSVQSKDGTVRVFKLTDKGLVGKRQITNFSVHSHAVTAASWQPEGQLLASGDSDGMIVVWRRQSDGGAWDVAKQQLSTQESTSF